MTEKSFKMNAKDFKEVIDNLYDEIMIFDDDYNLIYLNNASMRHYGIQKTEFIGKKFSDLDEVYWGNSTLPDVYQKKKIVAKRQLTNLGVDIITISVPILDDDGNIKYVGQNVNDIYYKNEFDEKGQIACDIFDSNDNDDEGELFIYGSEKMSIILSMVHKIKNIKSPCLILGETGTGKSHLAKYMHQNSKRNKNLFVSLNCACMNPNLLESELFGYVKGAFTGANTNGKQGLVEIADGGTLFLDEISEIPFDLQAKLLQFIQNQEFIPVGGNQSKKVNTKIVAATNRSLKKMVEQKAFREDLYFRLNTFEITIPPLRERIEDLRVLIDYYLTLYNKWYYRKCTISKEALNVLLKYSWPGNVREVAHVLEKIIVLTKNQEIMIGDLPKTLFELNNKQNYLSDGEDRSLNELMSEVEKKIIIECYNKNKTSVGVAKELKISQPKAYRLIQKYIANE
ncbi:MAG: sigma 54-interacting transcriptional regulator [Dethiosulfatibacter sp.]|nr:sigma 54-interacting transcriptional regulator [Dethiosulfatibacter sp.]